MLMFSLISKSEIFRKNKPIIKVIKRLKIIARPPILTREPLCFFLLFGLSSMEYFSPISIVNGTNLAVKKNF